VLFRNRLFTVNLITLLVFVGLGSGVLIPFYLETVLGYGVQQVGLLLAVVPIALGIVSPISGVLSDRVAAGPSPFWGWR
jgi:MFS family permease